MRGRGSKGSCSGCSSRAACPLLTSWFPGKDSMRFSLINPARNFEGSIYLGCREPHLPLEYGYSKALLERAGHTVEIVDAQLDGLTLPEVYNRVAEFRPDFTV